MTPTITTGNMVSWFVSLGVGLFVGLLVYIWKKEVNNLVSKTVCIETRKDCRDNILSTVTEFISEKIQSIEELFMSKLDNQVLKMQKEILDEVRKINQFHTRGAMQEKTNETLIKIIDDLREKLRQKDK